MATVYLAEDLRHHRQVAVKVLRPELAATLTCPPGLEAVIMRCLGKRPADRWQTAEELLAQLERWRRRAA